MALSDSDYGPKTPPLAPTKRTRKRTAKALDALQQLPTTRTLAEQPRQSEGSATAVLLTRDDCNGAGQLRIRIWWDLTQRHMGVRVGERGTSNQLLPIGLVRREYKKLLSYLSDTAPYN
ncbi:hypothetical protein EJ04DRAFT_509476 [Polyplosphaeria fusca]|uniref:Uncharacterized protein n=1 Tax=Polyplosphaeria fusca TaxID=682080 RepID=A0A9P4V6R5_9PLEO|nr:hypothetical protein EJ04DRAFT_509476 [Polyplosphaeria fusca]